MAYNQPSPTASRKSPRSLSLHNSTFLSQSGLNDTLHSTQSLSGRSSIMTYKSTQYPSASAALAAYISDFEGAHPPSKTYHRTVEDLLTPRSVLLRTVDRSLDTGVRDTRAEWRRYVSKKLLDESYSEMVQADLEREKAQSLIESTRHLTSDLSPLPGSSVVTEMESEVSVSTDALLLAPPYPPIQHPPPPRPKDFIPRGSQSLKTEALRRIENCRLEERRMQSSRRQGLAAGRSQTEASSRLKPGHVPLFPSDISPVKKLVTSSVPSVGRKGHLVNNSGRSPKFENLTNLQIRRSPVKDGSGVGVVPGLQDQNLSGGGPGDESNPLRRQNLQTDGRRPPPSWIQDLEGSGISGLISGPHPGGRAPPSWIQELDASQLTSLPSRVHAGGRAPPSWIQDLEASGIGSRVNSKTQEQRDGGRPPPSWIQDLNSTFTSGIHGSNTTAKHPEYLATHTLGRGRLSTQNRDPLRRSNSASDLITSAVFHDVTATSQPPGLTVRDFDYSEHILRSLEKERLPDDSKRSPTSSRTVKFSENAKPKKTYSYTTDDLISASPTGKVFHLPQRTSRGQYSANAFSNKYSHSNSRHHRAGYDDRLASKRSLGAARELFQHEASSARGDAIDLLSSTPKHSVDLDPTFARRSVNGYANKGLTSRSDGGYSVDTLTRKMERTIDDVDREREDALLERAEKVLDAARASRGKPNPSSTRHHFEESDRREDADRHDNSLLTEEILDGDRPWERNLPTYKPVNPALDSSQDKPHHQQDIVTQFLEDCLRSTSENQKLTGGSQPGPVEALKNMLFTLQGMDRNTQSIANDPALVSEKEERQTSSSTETSTSSLSRSKNTVGLANARKQVTDKDTTSSSGSGTNFDEAPGGKSLQRAMEHLSRLKVLVNGGSRHNSHPSSTNAQVMSN
ncbi:uncharacterized protein LOC119737642 [Patiria miniata]|uniref:Uncharacterized protein n=1 Tax=Patiria miniata TaxID=46514 RepID=A0A914AX10_PATMI|nr:uncharacterized protein LOC119737642 [Patiria miniata]XP_038068059.1 uncharacterized protein LOC119737642 [Patiria miniata]